MITETVLCLDCDAPLDDDRVEDKEFGGTWFCEDCWREHCEERGICPGCGHTADYGVCCRECYG